MKKCETCDGSLLWQCAACKELSKSYCGIYAHLQSCTAVFQACEKCQKKFESHDDLEKHRHVCGEDLYLQCELCDYKTRIKGFFLKHVKVKHDLQSDDIRKWLWRISRKNANDCERQCVMCIKYYARWSRDCFSRESSEMWFLQCTKY